MNWRRGFFRSWCLFFVSCLIGAGLLYGPAYKQAYDELELPLSQVLPVRCDAVRGEEGKDYTRATELCWYSFPSFRRLFPEYSDLDDRQLNEKVQARTYGITPNTELMNNALRAGVLLGFGLPVVVLLIGGALGWVLAGFRKNRPA